MPDWRPSARACRRWNGSEDSHGRLSGGGQGPLNEGRPGGMAFFAWGVEAGSLKGEDCVKEGCGIVGSEWVGRLGGPMSGCELSVDHQNRNYINTSQQQPRQAARTALRRCAPLPLLQRHASYRYPASCHVLHVSIRTPTLARWAASSSAGPDGLGRLLDYAHASMDSPADDDDGRPQARTWLVC